MKIDQLKKQLEETQAKTKKYFILDLFSVKRESNDFRCSRKTEEL